MGNEYGIYDGRAIRPILKAHAKKVGMSYPEVRKQFIEKIAAPATKRFEKMAPQLSKKLVDTMIESTKNMGITIIIDDHKIEDGKVELIKEDDKDEPAKA